MEFLSVFDVLGPKMIGPSSSHTAGAVSIGKMARKMFPEPVRRVRFTLYGSFAQTYRGHGTDKALLGGILGFDTYDMRIRDAFRIAGEQEIAYEYLADTEEVMEHPNTVEIQLWGISGREMSVRGESTGGGRIRITRINGIRVEFTGEYSTLIVRQFDKPGVVAHITRSLADQNVNIALMRLFRENKGELAYTVVESDEKIPREVLKEIEQNPFVEETLLIQL